MPDEYIKREDALQAIWKQIQQMCDSTNPFAVSMFVRSIRQVVREVPAADVAEVRHGHWVYKMRELIRYEDVTGTDPLGGIQTVTVKTHVRGAVPYCSLCDALAADSFLEFCPRCGAKMDKEEENV